MGLKHQGRSHRHGAFGAVPTESVGRTGCGRGAAFGTWSRWSCWDFSMNKKLRPNGVLKCPFGTFVLGHLFIFFLDSPNEGVLLPLDQLYRGRKQARYHTVIKSYGIFTVNVRIAVIIWQNSNTNMNIPINGINS